MDTINVWDTDTRIDWCVIFQSLRSICNSIKTENNNLEYLQTYIFKLLIVIEREGETSTIHPHNDQHKNPVLQPRSHFITINKPHSLRICNNFLIPKLLWQDERRTIINNTLGLPVFTATLFRKNRPTNRIVTLWHRSERF